MTDNEILDCLKKTHRRLSPGRDRVSAVKFYCNYLKEGKGSFSVYVDKYVPKGYFGYSNKASLRSVASAMYRDIKNLIGRDFYNGVAPLLPPTTQPQESVNTADSRGTKTILEAINTQLVALTKEVSALLIVTKEVWQYEQKTTDC